MRCDFFFLLFTILIFLKFFVLADIASLKWMMSKRSLIYFLIFRFSNLKDKFVLKLEERHTKKFNSFGPTFFLLTLNSNGTQKHEIFDGLTKIVWKSVVFLFLYLLNFFVVSSWPNIVSEVVRTFIHPVYLANKQTQW